MELRRVKKSWCLLLGACFFSLTLAGDWPTWRGPHQNGVSDEAGLIDEWTLDGPNLLWRVDFMGRSTPVVHGGRVYVQGRVGDGIDKQERVVGLDARTGRMLWDYRFNAFLTTVPFPRVGWASPAVDPEIGNIYVHGVAGLLICLDRDGKVVWQRSLTEEFGRMSGYGGRTHTPVVDGDLVIISAVFSGWGSYAAPRQRYMAFNKRSGRLIWISTPGGAPQDLNTYSTAIVGVVNGRRLLIGGNADGYIYALKVGTGEKVWGFGLSKRGINASVVLDGDRVYASHSEENMDRAVMGRVVAIDATGTGDVTKTHEVWRHDQLAAGFASPVVHDNRVYVIDNSANLHSLNAATGELVWMENVGTVGKGSPVWAEGKLYITEVNGTVVVLRPGRDAPQLISRVTIPLGDRHAEIYGSPAIAYQRIFFATEEGIYCLGDPDRPFEVSQTPVPGPEKGSSEVTHIQVVPAEVLLRSGESVDFSVLGFDAEGNRIGEVSADSWEAAGFEADLSGGGLTAPQISRAGTGEVTVRVGALESSARVRLLPAIPWVENFESVEEGHFPGHWIGAANRFSVKTMDGNKILSKPRIARGIQRSYVYFGAPQMSAGYTLQVDVLGTQDGRRVPDMGLIANRYILMISGGKKRLNVHSWASELRMEQETAFEWEPDVWYTMKMKVEIDDGRALIKGKAWKRDDEEPADWTIVAEDPHANERGTPGLYGQSYAEIFYDNLKLFRER